MKAPLSLAAIALSLVLVPAAHAQDPAEVTYLAQRRYDEGLAAYEAGETEAALAHFRASFEMARSPNTRLMVARCLRNLERFAEAMIEYELTEREASDRARTETRFEATRTAAAEESAAIEGRVGHVRVSIADAPPSIAIEVAGRSVPRQALEMPIPVDAGTVVIRARAPGYGDAEQTIEVAAGATLDVLLTLERHVEEPVAPPITVPAPSAISPADVIGGVALAFAIAGTGTGIGLSVAAQSRYDGLVAACGSSPCGPSFDGAIAEGRSFEIGTYVAFAIAGVAAITAIVAFVLRATDGPEQRADLPGVIRW